MHPVVFEQFEKICAPLAITGNVLEIGVAKEMRPLLELSAVASAAQRVGVGLEAPWRGEGYEVLQRNAHDLRCFEDAHFDLILSNSMFEHDAAFWLTLSEARRVLRPGGFLVVGVPGFGKMGSVFGRKLLGHLSWAHGLPFIGRRLAALSLELDASSPTLGFHGYPSDFYRFSRAAVHDVLLADLVDRSVQGVLKPLRFIGVGRRPLAQELGDQAS